MRVCDFQLLELTQILAVLAQTAAVGEHLPSSGARRLRGGPAGGMRMCDFHLPVLAQILPVLRPPRSARRALWALFMLWAMWLGAPPAS